MSRRARLRLAAAALLALVAGVVLATGRLTGTFALFTAETENQASTFSGDWVAAPTGLGAPTVSGLGASLAWTHATHGVTGQEIWYADQTTTTNCTAVNYTTGLVTGASLSATANSISGTGSPNDAVPSGDNGDNICFQIRSTHNTWYTGANFAVIQVGLVPTSLAYNGAGHLNTNNTITVNYNQAVAYSGGNVTVCTFTNGTVLIGDTCAASSDTPTIGTLAGGTSNKTSTCANSTVVATASHITVTLKNCTQNDAVSGTATYTAAGSTVTSSTGGASQCTKSNCKPTLTY